MVETFPTCEIRNSKNAMASEKWLKQVLNS